MASSHNSKDADDLEKEVYEKLTEVDGSRNRK
jgi:hypothetical protein